MTIKERIRLRNLSKPTIRSSNSLKNLKLLSMKAQRKSTLSIKVWSPQSKIMPKPFMLSMRLERTWRSPSTKRKLPRTMLITSNLLLRELQRFREPQLMTLKVQRKSLRKQRKIYLIKLRLDKLRKSIKLARLHRPLLWSWVFS